MRKAEYIVSQLLEDAANGATTVFGPDLPSDGIKQPSLEAALRPWQQYAKGNREVDPRLLDQLINNGYSFVVQTNPKDLVVYSKNQQVRVGHPETIQNMLSYYGISSEAQVSWKQSSAAAGHAVPITQVFVEEKVPDKTQAPEPEIDDEEEDGPPVKPAVPITAPGKPNPLEGPSAQPDPERERQVADIAKAPVSGIPVSFGLNMSKMKDGLYGAKVYAVDRNGPASQSGIQTQDRIVQVGRFETERGTFGPYSIRNLDDFKKVCGMMQGLPDGFAVPLKINRGGADHNVAVIPVRQSDPDEAELQRHLQDAEHLTLAEIARQLGRRPEEVQNLLKRLGGRAKDWIPPQTASDTMHVKGAQQYTPNERPPAAQTGNQRANVSSIT